MVDFSTKDGHILRDELDPSTFTTLDMTSLAAMLTGYVNANTTDVRLDGTVTRAADFVPPTGIYQLWRPHGAIRTCTMPHVISRLG